MLLLLHAVHLQVIRLVSAASLLRLTITRPPGPPPCCGHISSPAAAEARASACCPRTKSGASPTPPAAGLFPGHDRPGRRSRSRSRWWWETGSPISRRRSVSAREPSSSHPMVRAPRWPPSRGEVESNRSQAHCWRPPAPSPSAGGRRPRRKRPGWLLRSLSQENRCAWANPRVRAALRPDPESPISRRIARARSSGRRASTIRPPSPTTSGIEAAPDAMTGVPQAIASSGGDRTPRSMREDERNGRAVERGQIGLVDPSRPGSPRASSFDLFCYVVGKSWIGVAAHHQRRCLGHLGERLNQRLNVLITPPGAQCQQKSGWQAVPPAQRLKLLVADHRLEGRRHPLGDVQPGWQDAVGSPRSPAGWTRRR